jgi:hypothetical protein
MILKWSRCCVLLQVPDPIRPITVSTTVSSPQTGASKHKDALLWF